MKIKNKKTLIDHLASNLSTDHNHPSLSNSFASNLCVRILLQVGVENSVGYLVTHLV